MDPNMLESLLWGPPRSVGLRLRDLRGSGAYGDHIILYPKAYSIYCTVSSSCFPRISKVPTVAGVGPPDIAILVAVITFEPSCCLGI